MKKIINFLCLIIFLIPNIATGQNVSESFETNSCSYLGIPFYIGCFPDWISVSATPDALSNYSGVTPFDGNRYVRMYSKYAGNTCPTSTRRGESIAINYNFNAGQEYTVSFALRWNRDNNSNTWFNTKLVLTNNRNNQTGSHTGCQAGEILPFISGSDEVIKTYSLAGNQNNWQIYTETFTPTSNFNQLWIRPEMKLKKGGNPSTESLGRVYLDAFELETCVIPGLDSKFTFTTFGDQDGNVTINTFANPNPVYVNHWWDVFYAPGGSTSGNSQVPGNPIQCCSSPTASFSNNLTTNVWYYVKHGIWNSCNSWRETRTRFRVQHFTPSSGGSPKYKIEIEEVDFEPSEEYLSKMNENL